MGDKKTLRNKSFSLVLAFFSSLLFPAAASGASVDMTLATVVVSESTEVRKSANNLSVYLENFRPGNEIWLNVILPVPDSLSAVGFSPKEFDSTGALTRLSFLLPESLPLKSIDSRLGQLVTSDGMSSISIYMTPPDFPSWSIEGTSNILSSKELLLTPSVVNGSYAVAIKNGKVVFFQKSQTFTLAFKRIEAPVQLSLPSGQAKYAFSERVQNSKTFFTQGIWKLLDSNFEQIGTINKPKIFGKPQITEGHDLTVSPLGNAVTMSYVDRKVDSSWLEKPFASSNILDCVFSEIKNGKAIKTFSFWNWVSSHKAQFKKILGAGDRAQDNLVPTKPVDFCHANSLEYSKELDAYLISMRSIDLVIQVDRGLKSVQRSFYSPGARQHFAEYSPSNGYTALGNYTSGKNSKFQQWKKQKGKWVLTEMDFPLMMAYCGNNQIVDRTLVWLGGGCGNPETDTMGILYEKRNSTLVEISRLKSSGTTGSYRVDLN